MSDRGVLFLISLIMVLACLGAAVWLVATGQVAYMDGIFLLACCLVTALAFGVYLRVMIRQALEELRSPAPKTASSGAVQKVAATRQPAVEVEAGQSS